MLLSPLNATGPRLPVLFPRCLAARSEAHAHAPQALLWYLTHPLSLDSGCCLSLLWVHLSWPLLGTPPFTQLPYCLPEVLFTRIARAQFQDHCPRLPWSLLCSFSVSVPLGSSSFAPLPGFSQVNLFSLQSRPLRVPLSGSRPLFPPVHLGRISSLTPVPPEFSRLSHGPESLFKSPR